MAGRYERAGDHWSANDHRPSALGAPVGLLTLMYGLRRDGKYACGAGGLAASLPRQVGKIFTFGTAAFLDCLLTPGLKVLWTAHRSRTSDETFASMQTLAHDAKLARYVATIRRANGQQEIGFHNESRILFGAREQGFGRGFDGIDQIVFDEAQILTERALDDMVPATNTAANPLIVMIGTPPKPGDPAEIFRDKRRTALAGADKDLLYVEFSAPRGSDLDDREAWTAANPSYPQRTSETAIARMRAMLSDDSFRREALGIWDKTDIAHAIDPQQWEQAGVSERRDGGAAGRRGGLVRGRHAAGPCERGYRRVHAIRGQDRPHRTRTLREHRTERPRMGGRLDRRTMVPHLQRRHRLAVSGHRARAGSQTAWRTGHHDQLHRYGAGMRPVRRHVA